MKKKSPKPVKVVVYLDDDTSFEYYPLTVSSSSTKTKVKSKVKDSEEEEMTPAQERAAYARKCRAEQLEEEKSGKKKKKPEKFPTTTDIKKLQKILDKYGINLRHPTTAEDIYMLKSIMAKLD